MRTGAKGVVSTRAAPAFQSASCPAAAGTPRPGRSIQADQAPSTLMVLPISTLRSLFAFGPASTWRADGWTACGRDHPPAHDAIRRLGQCNRFSGDSLAGVIPNPVGWVESAMT